MKNLLTLVLVLSFGMGCASVNPSPAQQRVGLTRFNRLTIDHHVQEYAESCIPSSVEMVLKLLGRVSIEYYDQQNAWQHKIDGTFGNFDNKTIKGVTFHRQFDLPRNDQFPLSSLFQTIDRELRAGRYVIVSLPSNVGYHMYVIYDEDGAGDFLAISKFGSETTETGDVKAIIRGMKGTDIMTYQVGGR